MHTIKLVTWLWNINVYWFECETMKCDYCDFDPLALTPCDKNLLKENIKHPKNTPTRLFDNLNNSYLKQLVTN